MLDHIELVCDGENKHGAKQILAKFFTTRTDVMIASYDDDLRDIAERFSRYAHGRLKPCSVSSPWGEPGRPGCIAVCVAMDISSHADVMDAVNRLLDHMNLEVMVCWRFDNTDVS